MNKAHGTITTIILGSPWSGTAAIYSILDVLASVGRDWEMLHGVPAQPPTFAAMLLSRDGRPYRDPNGRRVIPEGGLADCPVPDLVIVPDMHLDPAAGIPAGFAPLAGWIGSAYRGGATVTSICSGSLLLATAGLLDGVEATTHWGYRDMMTRFFPDVRLRSERILVPAGEGHRLITAGGASAWADLVLYLIARLAGSEKARQIAKLYLLDPHTDGQLCYASLTAGRQHDDGIISDAQVWAATHYDEPNPVSLMAERSGLSNRGFLRRFRRATGQSPVEYVQTLRVEEAKHLLETTEKPIDDIAAEIGYSEPSSFRSAFRKQVGLPASSYRRKWRGISRPASEPVSSGST